MVAPPLVDQAWRIFLTYTPHYTYIASKLGVFLERNHDTQTTDFTGYKKTLREYKKFYNQSHKMDYAIWVLFKSSQVFIEGFRYNLFLTSKEMSILHKEATKLKER